MSTPMQSWVESCRGYPENLSKCSFWQRSHYCEQVLRIQASSIQEGDKFLGAYEVFTDIVRIEQQKSQFKEQAVICIIGAGIGLGFGLMSGAKKIAAVAVVALLCFYAHRLYTNVWSFFMPPPSNQLLDLKLKALGNNGEIKLPEEQSSTGPVVDEVD